METILPILLFGGAFFLMMRFGCGAHSAGHGKQFGGCCGSGCGPATRKRPDTRRAPETTPVADFEATQLAIEGMSCTSCASQVERSLLKMPGVASVSVDFAAATADVTYRPGAVSDGDLVKAVRKTGYDAALADGRSS
jgi:copper chaperone CopZ